MAKKQAVSGNPDARTSQSLPTLVAALPQCCSASTETEAVQKAAINHMQEPAWGVRRPDGTWTAVQYCPFCGKMLRS